MAQCGACTVHLDGEPARSCVTPVSTVGERKRSRTIEGLSRGRRRTRCSRPGPRSTSCSAATASRARSWPRSALLAAKPEADRRRHRRRAVRQHLPLRHLPAHPRGGPPRRRARGEGLSPWSSPRAGGSSSRRSAVAGGRPGHRLRRAPARRGARSRRRPPAPKPLPPPNAFLRIGSRRQRDRAPRPLGDGPGHLDDAADARRRGAGRRLGEDPRRARAGGAGLRHTAFGSR